MFETTFGALAKVMDMSADKGKFVPSSRVVVDSAWEARVVSTWGGPERTLAFYGINPAVFAKLQR
jgi:hypothetical protein